MPNNLKKIEKAKISEIKEMDLLSTMDLDYFACFLKKKPLSFKLLITPLACQFLPAFMEYYFFCDLLLISYIFYMKLSLINILQAPVRMTLGIFDLALNIVIIALSLITRPITSLCYTAANTLG